MAATSKPARKVMKKMVKESHQFHSEKTRGNKQATKTRKKEHFSRLKESHHKGEPILVKGKHVKSLVNPKVLKENERMAAHKHMKEHGG